MIWDVLLLLHGVAAQPFYKCSGYWSGNRMPMPVAIGPAIGPVTGRPFRWLLVRQFFTCEQVTLVPKVAVSVVSTTVWLRETRWKLSNDYCIETP